MFFKVVQNILSFRSNIFRYRQFHKDHIKMKNAYVHYHENAEQFQLSLHYTNLDFGVNREFNFSRQISENVSDFLGRITSSFDKTLLKHINKKYKKQKSDRRPAVPEMSIVLTVDGIAVSGDTVCRDVIFGDGVASLQIKCMNYPDCADYSLIINAPSVRALTLPACIMSEFPVYPSKFELYFASKGDCILTWYKSMHNTVEDNSSKGQNSTLITENFSWTEAGVGYFYIPTLEDIGCHLKLTCLPKKGDNLGPVVETISKTSVEVGPGDCPFQQRHAFTTDRLQGNGVRVVSYNILADMYADSEVAHTELYPYCPAYALHIDYRKQLLVKEIIGYNADVMCFQEVDCKVYDLDLQPVLDSVGFQGVFHKKAGRVSEGLACMYHSSKFKLVESNSYYLAEDLPTNPLFADIWNIIKSQSEALVTRVMDRNTCVQVTVLESVSNPGALLVVGNTHLYFHPNADHIRLLQGGMAIRYLQHTAENLTRGGKRASVLMCGDFNSTPECGVYRLMTTQHVGEDCIDWNSKTEESIRGVTLSHSLGLSSACGTPDFTNFTVGFSGCLDYIFYQHDSLDVTQVVPLPSLEDVMVHTALPSVVFPSDHVAIVADLQWHNAGNQSVALVE